ncbi:hypothetical protein PR003_g25073, partial [Phytophthora rubi]
MHRAKAKAPLSIMEKRIPQNPRYKNTQSKIDSGSTVNKVRLISHKEFLKRRDETFRRITCRCLADLFGEYEDTGSASQPEMVARMVKGSDGEFSMERVPVDEDNQESCGPRIVSYEAEEKEDYDPPYLVLDTRTKDEFAANRIHRAKNYPSTSREREHAQETSPECNDRKHHGRGHVTPARAAGGVKSERVSQSGSRHIRGT